MIWHILLLLYLGVGSLFDIREKRIPIIWILFGLIIGGTKVCVVPFDTLGDVIFSISPGVVVIFLAWVCKKHIGTADGIAIMVIGMILGGDICVVIVCLALCEESFVGIFMIIFGKAKKETELPFFPFLGIGYLIANGMIIH